MKVRIEEGHCDECKAMYTRRYAHPYVCRKCRGFDD